MGKPLVKFAEAELRPVERNGDGTSETLRSAMSRFALDRCCSGMSVRASMRIGQMEKMRVRNACMPARGPDITHSVHVRT